MAWVKSEAGPDCTASGVRFLVFFKGERAAPGIGWGVWKPPLPVARRDAPIIAWRHYADPCMA
jgi:hypothetical protein